MILYVKQEIDGEYHWVPVPAIRGTSVNLTTLPTPFAAVVSGPNAHPSGWSWTLYDEKTNTSTEMYVYNGADGSGSVSQVDGVAPANGNVNLNAIRYTTMSLTSAQQSIARSNINAMQNVVGSSSGQVIMYDATTSNWVAANFSGDIVPNAIPSADIINLFN